MVSRIVPTNRIFLLTPQGYSLLAMNLDIFDNLSLFFIHLIAFFALAATFKLHIFTARCGACSYGRLLFRHCFFARRFCLWLSVAQRAESSPYIFITIIRKKPLANPTLITFLELDGLIMIYTYPFLQIA